MIANHLHLTLTNIIKDQSFIVINEAVRLQGLSRKGLLDLNSIIMPGINTIHHSLVNFLPPTEFLGQPYEIAKFKEKHQNLIRDINKFVNQEISNIRDTNIIVGGAHKGEKGIALEAYPSPDIIQFAKSVTNKIKTKKDYPRVKGFPPENSSKFAINIIRFFRELEKTEDRNLTKTVSTINNQLKAEPIKFELKNLTLVVSDDYLSNSNPQVKQYFINKKLRK